MLEWVRFVAVLPVDFWCCEGVLFIKTGLSAEKKAEIIKNHLEG